MAGSNNIENILISFENSSGCGCDTPSNTGSDITRAEILRLLSKKADLSKVLELFNSLLNNTGNGEPGDSATVSLKKDTPLIVTHTRNSTNVIAAFYSGNNLLFVNYKPSSESTITVYPHNSYDNVRVIIY